MQSAWIAFGAVAGLCVVAGHAAAQVPAVDVVSVLDGNYSRNSAAALRQNWRHIATVNGASVGRTFLAAAPGGRTVAAEFVVALTDRQIAVAAARSIAGVVMGPVAGGAILAWSVYDALRVRGVDTATAPGGLMADPGADPGYVGAYRATAFNGSSQIAAQALTAQEVCERLQPMFAAAWPAVGGMPNAQVVFHGVTTGSATSCYTSRYVITNYTNGVPQTIFDGGDTFGFVTAIQMSNCGAIVDPFDSAFNRPAGRPVGADGRCDTGRYTVPKTAEEAGDMERQSQNHPNMVDLWNEVLGRGGAPGIAPRNDWQQDVVVSPGTLPGATTSTSNPDGTVTETATGWNFAKDPIVSKDIRFTPTTTTTTRNAAGQIIAGPTTTTGAGAGAAGNPAVDPCVGDPGRLGCIGLGTVPDTPLGTREVNVAITPQSGWGSAIGSCPAPRTMVVQGQMIEINNSVLCDFLRGIRFVLVGCAAISGALIFSGGMKE